MPKTPPSKEWCESAAKREAGCEVGAGAGRLVSTRSTLDDLLAQVREYVVSPEERRAQAISWAVGQVLCERPDADEWVLRVHAAKHYDQQKGPR